MRNRSLASPTGFTLIEVMIAMAILAGLTMLTANAIKSAVDNRTWISREISRDEQLSSALNIIRSDVAGAFHHHDVSTKVYNQAVATPTPPWIQVPPPAPQWPTPRATPAQMTGFIGEGDSMYFTSLTNRRTLRDSPVSTQAKVGYFVKSCTAGPKQTSTKCLYRSLSPYIDQNLEDPGPETMLVEYVEEFALRYFSPNPEDDPRATWKTGKNGDDLTKNNFPVAVEITLTLHDKSNPKDRAATQTVLAPILFPNNPPKPKPGPG